MAEIALADALLRRKELAAKVESTKSIKGNNVFEQRVQRIKVSDGIDEVTAHVPKLTLSQVTHEHDFFSRALRNIDSAIQQANWTTKVTVPDDSIADYVPPAGWNK
jgi:hypothetical protein